MTLEQVMKMYGLNARGAKKKMKQLGIEEVQSEEETATEAVNAETTAAAEAEAKAKAKAEAKARAEAEAKAETETSAANDKWVAMVEKLKTYNGRFTKDGFPHTQDFEKCVGVDVTPEQVKKLWEKFMAEQALPKEA